MKTNFTYILYGCFVVRDQQKRLRWLRDEVEEDIETGHAADQRDEQQFPAVMEVIQKESKERFGQQESEG